jgi:hypothetical protein
LLLFFKFLRSVFARRSDTPLWAYNHFLISDSIFTAVGPGEVLGSDTVTLDLSGLVFLVGACLVLSSTRIFFIGSDVSATDARSARLPVVRAARVLLR